MQNSGYCSLIITGENLDFDLIEKNLKIKVSEKWKKGQLINVVVGESKKDFIRFNKKMEMKLNPNQTLNLLLDNLLRSEKFLLDLKKESEMYIKCYVQSDYAQINYVLSPEVLIKIVKLGIELEICVISWGKVEDKK